jgi:hypothetical protein
MISLQSSGYQKADDKELLALSAPYQTKLAAASVLSALCQTKLLYQSFGDHYRNWQRHCGIGAIVAPSTNRIAPSLHYPTPLLEHVQAMVVQWLHHFPGLFILHYRSRVVRCARSYRRVSAGISQVARCNACISCMSYQFPDVSFSSKRAMNALKRRGMLRQMLLRE